VALAATTAGSAALGDGAAEIAIRRRMAVAPLRSLTIGLAAATATTLVASGRNQVTVAGGVFSGAALFVLAAAFGAALLLGRRPSEVREPIGFFSPAIGLVLVSLVAADRLFVRGEGLLLVVLFGAYGAWASTRPGRDPPTSNPDAPARSYPGWGSEPRPDGGSVWPAGVAVSSGDESARSAGDLPAITARPEPGVDGASSGAASRVALHLVVGLALVAGGAWALVEGAVRVEIRAPLAPGFAGAAIAGSVAALPFALLVLFARRRTPDTDPTEAALGTVTGLLTLVPGLAAVARPFELDGPAAIALLGAAGLYAVAGTWMLFRGHGGRVLGALVLVAYAACLTYAGSL
jgi:Ca2+/Na+ antiporter